MTDQEFIERVRQIVRSSTSNLDAGAALDRLERLVDLYDTGCGLRAASTSIVYQNAPSDSERRLHNLGDCDDCE